MCSAAEDQVVMTRAEFNKYSETLNKCDRTLEIVGMNSSKSVKELLTVEQRLQESERKLKLSEEKLAQVEKKLEQYENALKETSDLLAKQDKTLENANLTLIAYAKEMKSKVASLKAQKGIWQGVTAIAVGALIWQASKVK